MFYGKKGKPYRMFSNMFPCIYSPPHYWNFVYTNSRLHCCCALLFREEKNPTLMMLDSFSCCSAIGNMNIDFPSPPTHHNLKIFFFLDLSSFLISVALCGTCSLQGIFELWFSKWCCSSVLANTITAISFAWWFFHLYSLSHPDYYCYIWTAIKSFSGEDTVFLLTVISISQFLPWLCFSDVATLNSLSVVLLLNFLWYYCLVAASLPV